MKAGKTCRLAHCQCRIPPLPALLLQLPRFHHLHQHGREAFEVSAAKEKKKILLAHFENIALNAILVVENLAYLKLPVRPHGNWLDV